MSRMSLADASHWLKIPESALVVWVEQGFDEIPYRRDEEGVLWFDSQALQKWVDAHEVPGDPE